jgi:signal transduction histidine kinase
MVTPKRLPLRAKSYILAVIVVGSAIGMVLAARADLHAPDALPLAVFCGFGVLASTLDIARRSITHSRLSYQIGSSFAYPLLVLVDPGAVCIVFTAMALADKFFHRRSLITTGFNVGQLMLACAAAVQVQRWIHPEFAGLDLFDHRSVIAAIVSMSVFAIINNALTRGVVHLVNGTPLLSWDGFSKTGFLNETLCIVSGLGMAVLWIVEPWLVLLGAIPVWVMGYMIATLNLREAALETRETEIRSLQGLGLRIGSELNIDRLRQSVLTVASEALEASGGLLASIDRRRGTLEVQQSHGIDPAPPGEIPLAGLPESLFDEGHFASLDVRDAAGRWPGVAFPDASGLLVAPLRIQDEYSNLLVLFRDRDRVAFDDDDRRRLETLVPFINVALSNATLVSERRALQAQVLEAEKMSALGVLVAGVAHELNNPLTSVLGYAELLGASEPDHRRREQLGKIGQEAKRAARIVQNLRMFSRESKPDKVPVDLNQVVEQVLELRGEDLEARDIDVETRLASQLPEVMADASQLQQVLLHLLSNAERAVGEVDRRGRLTIVTRAGGGQVRLEVVDNGPGIRPENLEQIFLPFFTTQDLGHGPGLGLSICYGILKEHEGRIRADSEVGQGASFIVDLPQAARDGGTRQLSDGTEFKVPV